MKKNKIYNKYIYLFTFAAIIMISIILNCVELENKKIPPPKTFYTNIPTIAVETTTTTTTTKTTTSFDPFKTTTTTTTTTSTYTYTTTTTTTTTTYKTFGPDCGMTLTSVAYYGYNNNNHGGATITIDTSDSDALDVDQPIPEQGETVTPLCPVILFMNDIVYFDSLYHNVQVIDVSTSNTIYGTVNVNPYVNPNLAQPQSIIIFSPYLPFPENTTIEFRLKHNPVWPLKDDDGHTLTGSTDYVLTFDTNTIDPNAKAINGNEDFDHGDWGYITVGDAGRKQGTWGSGTPPLGPHNGQYFMGLSSGSQIVSSGSALQSRTSVLVIGPFCLQQGASFYYNFISEEFNEYCSSQYDDVAMVLSHGPYGGKVQTDVLATVNEICGTYSGALPSNLEVTGTPLFGAYQIGWQEHILSFNAGIPFYLTFIVSNIGDTMLPSLLLIDEIH